MYVCVCVYMYVYIYIYIYIFKSSLTALFKNLLLRKALSNGGWLCI